MKHNALSNLVLASFLLGCCVYGLMKYPDWSNNITIFDTAIYLITTVIIVFYLLNRPPPDDTDYRWRTVFISMFSTLYFLLLIPMQQEIVGPWCYVCLLGFHALADFSIAYLGKSFSIIPARREIKVGWLYKFVRHPIYSLYIVGDMLFLVLSFSWWNFSIAVLGTITFFIRANLEEKLLSCDPIYQHYMRKVRYRFFPGIY